MKIQKCVWIHKGVAQTHILINVPTHAILTKDKTLHKAEHLC